VPDRVLSIAAFGDLVVIMRITGNLLDADVLHATSRAARRIAR
jgi:hypothetical protein